MVLKDEVLKGLRFELSRDEIRKIYQSDSYENMTIMIFQC